jgi:hypothetical protein
MAVPESNGAPAGKAKSLSQKRREKAKAKGKKPKEEPVKPPHPAEALVSPGDHRGNPESCAAAGRANHVQPDPPQTIPAPWPPYRAVLYDARTTEGGMWRDRDRVIPEAL